LHSALMGFLAVNYEANDAFFRKFYDPESAAKWPPRPHRHQALGDLCDRFIFDFIIGNTDRGMNDHNNFVFGGCSERTSCHVPKEPWQRLKSKPKYAFIDHGSSLHSHKEPKENPFTGNHTKICRFRRATYDNLKKYVRTTADKKRKHKPLPHAVKARLDKRYSYFNVVSEDVFRTTQSRLEKVVAVADKCVEHYGEERVFVL
jgi:hypothetical protein